MKLKEFFNSSIFSKSTKIAEYSVLTLTAFCGLIWAEGFYYLCILLGIVALLLIVAKVCHAKYAEEAQVTPEVNSCASAVEEKSTIFTDSYESSEEVKDEVLSPDRPKYRFLADEAEEEAEEEVQEVIPDGIFYSEDGEFDDFENSIKETDSDTTDEAFDTLEKELTPYGKELLKTWNLKYAEYDNCIEMGWDVSELEPLEEELDKISLKIQAEREKFLEKAEALKKAKIEENKKRLEARRAKLGL